MSNDGEEWLQAVMQNKITQRVDYEKPKDD